MTPEPFVSAEVAAAHLGINRRFLLSLARQGLGGSYALGTGQQRKTWVFRLSELGVAIDHRHTRPFPFDPPPPPITDPAPPEPRNRRSPRRKQRYDRP